MAGTRFSGFSPDAYRFLVELRFNNNKEFFDQNRTRYHEVLKTPLKQLAQELLPTALEIDPSFNPRLTSILSRIHRDTRYTKDKSPYRAHAWLSFRHVGDRISEGFCLYYEMTPEYYGYGMGMWGGNPELMKAIRARILAAPTEFLAEVNTLLEAGFTVEGEMFKRDRFPTAPEALKPYLNRKGLSFCYECPTLKPTMSPDLLPELEDAFRRMGRLYRFLFIGNEKFAE